MSWKVSFFFFFQISFKIMWPTDTKLMSNHYTKLERSCMRSCFYPVIMHSLFSDEENHDLIILFIAWHSEKPLFYYPSLSELLCVHNRKQMPMVGLLRSVLSLWWSSTLSKQVKKKMHKFLYNLKWTPNRLFWTQSQAFNKCAIKYKNNAWNI